MNHESRTESSCRLQTPNSGPENRVPGYNGRMRRRAFTLIELLVVIAIISILSAILFPVFARAKESAKASKCISNLHQLGLGIDMYLSDSDDRFPDRRDLKLLYGYKPWSTWPTSDPRSGWALVLFAPYVRDARVWSCDSVSGSVMGQVPQVLQTTPLGSTRYWMWRFDRPDDPIPLDDFWGKTPDQCVQDLIEANNLIIGIPSGVSDVEMIVDPYFPSTALNVDPNLKGVSVHFGGRNREFLDWHAHWLRDVRLNG